MTNPNSRTLKLDPFWMHLDPDRTFGRRVPTSRPKPALDVREVQCIAFEGGIRCLNPGSSSDTHGFLCEHHFDAQLEADLKRSKSKYPTNEDLELRYITHEILDTDAEKIQALMEAHLVRAVRTRSGYDPRFGV